MSTLTRTLAVLTGLSHKPGSTAHPRRAASRTARTIGSFVIAVCSVCVATTAAAATRTWVTDASGSWDVASNWSDGVVPQAGDVVVIDRPGVTITVTVNAGTNALASLLSNEHVIMAGGTLGATTSMEFNAGIDFSGGELTGAGALTLRGTSTWSGGTWSGAGGATLAPGATLTQTGNVYLWRPLVNQGTVTATGAMYVYGAAITNAAGAVWEAAGAWTASNQSGASTFANAGTLRKTGSGSGLVLSGVPLTDTGTLDLVAGTVTVTSATNSGVLSVAAGQVLNLANLTLASGTTFAGSGSLRLNGALAVSAAATITRPLAFDGGEVTGSGALTFAAPVTWSGGTFGGTSTATVAAGTTLVQTGNVYLSRPFINQGTVTATGAMYMYGAAITNAAGAVWEAAGAWTASNQSGASTFANAGTLRKTGSGSGLVLGGVPLTNTGTVDLVAGTVTVTSATNSGVLSVAAGQVLESRKPDAGGGHHVRGQRQPAPEWSARGERRGDHHAAPGLRRRRGHGQRRPHFRGARHLERRYVRRHRHRHGRRGHHPRPDG